MSTSDAPGTKLFVKVESKRIENKATGEILTSDKFDSEQKFGGNFLAVQ